MKEEIVIEVGCYDGVDSIPYAFQGYTVYTFEPKRDLYESIKARSQFLQNYNVINKAVCLQDGTMPFHICRDGGASSLLPFKSNEELQRHWTEHRTDIQYSGITYDVSTTRLDTFIEEIGVQNKIIHYLHIDAQGVDLECLMSLGKYVKNVRQGVLETVIEKEKAIYETQNLNTLANIEKFLTENDFVITNVVENDPTNCEYNVYFRNNITL